MVSCDDMESPMDLGGSKVLSIVFDMPTSWAGLSVDLLTVTESMSDWSRGVSCKQMRDGKCFSSEP